MMESMHDVAYDVIVGQQKNSSMITLVLITIVVAMILAAWPLFVVEKKTAKNFSRAQTLAARGEANESDPDVVIVGAGVAGASLAITLARQGKKVTVIEKSTEVKHSIVGELMQPGGVDALKKLGLEDCLMADSETTKLESVPIYGYVLISKQEDKDESFVLPYPKSYPKSFKEHFGFISTERECEGDTRPLGRGQRYGMFVERMREVLRAEPNVKVINGAVVDMIRVPLDKEKAEYLCTGVRYKRNDDESETSRELKAPLTIAADGGFSSLRKMTKKLSKDVKVNPVEVYSHFVGVVMRHKEGESPVPHRNHGHVVLAKPSPVLMYQICPTETRVLVDVPGKLPRASNGDLETYLVNFVAPQLPEVSRKPFMDGAKEGPILSMPNKSLWMSQPPVDGCFFLGDSYNMRHPLTGGGMSVALKDTIILANELAPIKDMNMELDGVRLQAIRETFEEKRRGHSSTVNILANALYRVFSAPDGMQVREDLRLACYQYLSRRGVCLQGPTHLLAIISPIPLVLVTHFFLVALYGVMNQLLPFPTSSSLRRSYNLLHVACVVIMPMIEAESATILSAAPLRKIIQYLFPYKNIKRSNFGM